MQGTRGVKGKNTTISHNTTNRCVFMFVSTVRNDNSSKANKNNFHFLAKHYFFNKMLFEREKNRNINKKVILPLINLNKRTLNRASPGSKPVRQVLWDLIFLFLLCFRFHFSYFWLSL